MHKTFFSIAALACIICISSPVSAQAPLDPHTVSCFDHYRFGSVQVPIVPSVNTAVAGTPITFSGEIRNTNQYPIVQGRIIARIFKVSEDGFKNVNGPDVVDEFTVKDNVFLQASSTVPITLNWNIPQYTQPGSYKIALFFVSAGKFNLLGLTFTDDIIGNSASFSVVNEFYKNDSIHFVKKNVYTADMRHRFAAFPNRLPKTGDVPISAQVENTTTQDQKVDIVWKLYSWDAQHESNFISTKVDTVLVKAGGFATTTYVVTDTTAPVYYAVAELSYNGVKSIIAPRFVREGVERTRINFPAVTSYPLKKDMPVELFSCAHATSDIEDTASSTQGIDKMILSLKDKKGKTIHTYTYTGKITGEMMGVKDSFTPKKNYKDFTLSAELYRGEQLMDKVDMKYGCAELGGQGCEDTSIGSTTLSILIGLLILLFIAIKKFTGTKRVIMIVTLLVAACVSMYRIAIAQNMTFVAPTVNPKTGVLWNTVLANTNLYVRDVDSRIFKTAIYDPNITVAYRTEIRKDSTTGELVEGGESLPIGTRLYVKFPSHMSEDIYWFSTGSTWDSPYGSWGNSSVPPPTTCEEKDYVFTTTALGTPTVYHYVPLVITPPTKTITNPRGMTCSNISNNQSTCIVTGGEQIGLDMNFANTSGRFYYRRIDLWDSTKPCITPSPDISLSPRDEASGSFILQVPAQTIRYNFTAAPADNLPPSNPVISGPRIQDVGAESEFGFVSTDPNNDTVRYGIDWTDDGVDEVNTWVPATAFTADEVEQFVTKSWPVAGEYTFKVLAQDNKGANSGWTTHTITIAPDRCENISGWQPAPLFTAHGRDYFMSASESASDGKLYFSAASAPASSACTVDMCADTSALESTIPIDYEWDTDKTDPYARYSCVPISGANCGCVGRTQTCIDAAGAVVSQTPNATECALAAFCTYPTPVTGNTVTFTFGATNILGTLLGGGSVVKDISAQDGSPIEESRTLSDSADGQESIATCSYTPLASPISPAILSFTSTPIVEKGQACIFTWETQDVASCTLGGETVPVVGSKSFSTTVGSNVIKTLSCLSDEDTPQTLSQTKTCLVKPTVTEQ